MLIESEQFSHNIAKIKNLFKRSFNREIEEPYLIWRYVDNPLRQTLVSVKYAHGNIIANYSACPCLLSYESKTIKTALSMTTMTDPNHRGEGYFPVLAQELYDFMGQENYFMIWGFPNHFSHYTFVNHLNWNDIYEIPTMVLDLSSYSKNAVKFETDNNFDLSYEKSIIPDQFIHVLKSQDYLKWRYTKNPINQYYNIVISNRGIISSFLVLKHYGQGLDMVDFQAANYDEGEHLLQAAISYATEHQLRVINCWAPAHHFIHQLCERNGFINSNPITYFGGRLLHDHKDQTYFSNYSNWYIQMGDSDVY